MNKLIIKNITILQILALVCFAVVGCQKMDRPALGDYLADANPPGGPLKFYAAFDGTSTNALKNAVDSIRANFPAANPLASIGGISGKALQGSSTKAANYPSANDFKSATSCSVSLWLKSGGVPKSADGVQFVFSLFQSNFSWHNSAMFLYFDHDGAGATVDSASLTFAIKDNWYGFYGKDRLAKLHDQQWHHLVFVYDETTSKLTTYVDGQARTGLSNGAVSQNGVQGPLNFKQSDISNLVIGGWNKHAGLNGPTDGWINGFSGGIDQFRMYSKALSAAEVAALYANKQ